MRAPVGKTPARSGTKPTAEEVAELLRSRKKVRKEEGMTSRPWNLFHTEKERMGASSKVGVEERVVLLQKGVGDEEKNEKMKQSYRQVCEAGREMEVLEDEREEAAWWLNEGWRSRISVEHTAQGPNIVLLPEFKSKIAQRWKHTAIVTVLGMRVREEAIVRKLKVLWGDVDTIDLGMGFYMVDCKRQEVYERAITGGPWLMYDHYISARPWSADFDPEEDRVTSISAWVRIAKLPLDYYDQGTLYVIGSQIGEVLKVDKNTINQEKGRFARICIRLDLNKPLVPSILVNGKVKRVEYEGLHSICTQCGRYGHGKERCTKKEDDDRETIENDGMATGSKQRERKAPAAGETVTEESTYGEWMVVRRPWRGGGRRPVNFNRRVIEEQKFRDPGTKISGNSFEALALQGEETDVARIEGKMIDGAIRGAGIKEFNDEKYDRISQHEEKKRNKKEMRCAQLNEKQNKEGKKESDMGKGPIHSVGPTRYLIDEKEREKQGEKLLRKTTCSRGVGRYKLERNIEPYNSPCADVVVWKTKERKDAEGLTTQEMVMADPPDPGDGPRGRFWMCHNPLSKEEGEIVEGEDTDMVAATPPAC